MDNRPWLSIVEWEGHPKEMSYIKFMDACFDVFRKLYCSGKRRLEGKEKSETCFSLKKES